MLVHIVFQGGTIRPKLPCVLVRVVLFSGALGGVAPGVLHGVVLKLITRAHELPRACVWIVLGVGLSGAQGRKKHSKEESAYEQSRL